MVRLSCAQNLLSVYAMAMSATTTAGYLNFQTLLHFSIADFS